MNEGNILSASPNDTLGNLGALGLSREEKQNIFSASLVEFIGRILIEKMFFQNLHVPQELLLSIANSLIQTLNPSSKNPVNINLYQEGRILYKQWSGQTLTPEETHYDNAIKNVDVAGEILNGLKYSALALMGSNLYASVSSAISQGLWNHVPALVGYSSALLLGPQAIQQAVEKVLSCSGLTQKQKRELTPWLNTLGRLALGFIPKVRANEQGVHYQYPSLSGHTETFVTDKTPFKLHSIREITEQKIRLHVINEAGKKIPVEFRVNHQSVGKEITVKSPNKQLETQWGECFKPILSEEAITCSSSLIVGTVASAAGQNPLPAVLAAMNCIPKISAAGDVQKRYLEQTYNPPLTVNLPLDNQLTDIVIENGYAYTVNGQAGLKILDVSNLNNITNVSQYDTPGYAQRITLDKGYAYIADGASGLQIINVKNVMSPVFAGVWMTGNPVIDVAVINNTAYLADGTNQLTAIDISVPENVLNTLLKTTNAQDVTVSGNMAYVADGISGLRVIDVSNPTNPQLKGTLKTSYAQDIAISGNMAYVADATSGLRVVDVSNSTNPQLKGTFNTTYALDVTVSGNFAYVADFTSGLRIIDVSNVSDPKLKSTLVTSSAIGVTLSGNYAYVADSSSGLRIIDVSNASNPQLKSTIKTTYAKDVTIFGNYAYVAGGPLGDGNSAGLHIIDVSNASNPQLKGTLLTSDARGVTVSENYAYLADSFSGVRIIDVSNASDPQLKGTLNTEYAMGVRVSGKYLYVADRDSSARVIHIITDANPLISPNTYFFRDGINQLSKKDSNLWVIQSKGFQSFNPAVPNIFAHFQTKYAQAVAISGNYTYVTDSSGLRIIDVSNASNPQLKGTLLTSDARGVTVSENYAYVADYTSKFLIIDVSNSSNPQLQVTMMIWNPRDVTVSGNYAYVVGDSGLRIIDVSNASNPQLKSTFNTTYALHVKVSGNFAYVADASGFLIIDISNMTKPELKSKLLSMNNFWFTDVVVSGNYGYLVNGGSGLHIIDVSNASNPQLKSTFPTSSASGLTVSGNYAYLADYKSGILIIDVTNASNPFLLYQFNEFEAFGYFTDIVVSEKKVYLTTSLGLTIFDINNIPMKWLPFTSFPSPNAFLTVEPYVFISNNNGLSIFNISNNSQIQYLGRWNTSLTFNHMEVIENELWMGYSKGILVLNISDPTQPMLTGQYKCTVPANSFFASNNTLYFPGSYQCQFQSASTPTVTPTSTLTPTPTQIPTPNTTSTLNQTISNTTIFQNTGEVAGAVVGGIMGLATLAGLGFGIFKCRKNITPVQTLQGKDQDKVVDIKGIIKQQKPF